MPLELSNKSRVELLTAAQDQLGHYRAFKEMCRDFGFWAQRDSSEDRQKVHARRESSRRLKVDDEIGCFIDRQITGIKRRHDPALKLPFMAFELHYLTQAHTFELYYKKLQAFKRELAKCHKPYTALEIKAQENVFIEELRRSIITVLYLPE